MVTLTISLFFQLSLAVYWASHPLSPVPPFITSKFFVSFLQTYSVSSPWGLHAVNHKHSSCSPLLTHPCHSLLEVSDDPSPPRCVGIVTKQGSKPGSKQGWEPGEGKLRPTTSLTEKGPWDLGLTGHLSSENMLTWCRSKKRQLYGAACPLPTSFRKVEFFVLWWVLTDTPTARSLILSKKKVFKVCVCVRERFLDPYLKSRDILKSLLYVVHLTPTCTLPLPLSVSSLFFFLFWESHFSSSKLK